MRMQCNACSHLLIQAVSIATYVGSLLGVVLMYVWYAPSPACKLNILFITVTLALVQLMTFVSMSSKASKLLRHTHAMHMYIHALEMASVHCSQLGLGNEQVKAGYVAPGLMGIYVVFLCWSAIRR